MTSRGDALSGASLSLSSKALYRARRGSYRRVRTSRANPALRGRALRALPLRYGFARGTIFTLPLRFGLDRPPLRCVPSRPKPFGETKKLFRAPACCRALRSSLQTRWLGDGVNTDAYSRMHLVIGLCIDIVKRSVFHSWLMSPGFSEVVSDENHGEPLSSLLPAAFPLNADECLGVHTVTAFRSAGREAARTSRRSSAQRSARGTLKKRIAAALILRFKKRCNSRIVRSDKVCVCRTARPSAARSQTPLQGGSAPVDPRVDRSERTR
jgi:hypothetical protein